MHWLGIALFVGAGIVFVRWMLHRVDALGRPRPFPWFSTIFLCVLGGAALTPLVLRWRLEDRLSDAASVIVGAKVEVHCQSFGEAFVDAGAELGYVAYGPDGAPEKKTLIKRQQCHDLSDYVGSSKTDPSIEEAIALHTVTHEAMHMSGWTVEAEAECFAVQRDAELARLLGAPPEGARDIAELYWRVQYPRMPGDYRSPECGPGGALDRHTADAPWGAG